MEIGFVSESREKGEKRFACSPQVAYLLKQKGHNVLIERGGGVSCLFSDDEFIKNGANILSREEILGRADIIVSIYPLKDEDLANLKGGQTLISLMYARINREYLQKISNKKCSGYALELIPRTTIAQKMDVLSSQANLAGYQAVITASYYYGGVLPMMVTPAGTIKPAKVFIIGAGVAGLQAIGTAKRLGGVVEAYDVRPEVKEQIESLGAKFFDIKIEGTVESKGGYVTQLSEETLRKQREALKNKLAECDIVITTAQVFGKKAPIIITKEMVEAMKAGSVIVDLAAETGGNCELTRPDEIIFHNGVTIIGDTKLTSKVARTASELFAKNVYEFILHILGKKELEKDEIVKGALVVKDGQILIS